MLANVLDPAARRIIDPIVDFAARGLVAARLGANTITVLGFVIGLAAVPAIALDQMALALGLILANRIFDGLDGAVARRHGPTDFGGYLDAVCDFLFYSAVPLGFALRTPEDAPYAALLMLSFMGTGSSFLAYAALAAKRGLTTELRGRKSLYYLGGLTEGTETIVAFVLFCLFPDAFAWLASIFAALCLLTTGTRVAVAWQTLREPRAG